MKTEKKKLKRIPTKIVFLVLTLATTILVFTIYFIITFSTVSIKDNLKTAFSLDELPTIIKADKKADDGILHNVKDKSYKYAYTSKPEGLTIGLFSTSYSLPSDDKAGTIKYYIGFNSSDSSTKVSSCSVVVGEKWHDYCSSKSTVSSTAHSTKYVQAEMMTFYNSERTISIDKAQQFPKRYVLGMKKVESPNIYVYVIYTYKNKLQSCIVEFDYDMYFINGFTKVNSLS